MSFTRFFSYTSLVLICGASSFAHVNASTGSTVTSTGETNTAPVLQDFEGNDFGVWNAQDDSGIDMWRLGTGNTPSSFTGPNGPQEGNAYAYIESSDQNFPSKVGYLESPTFQSVASEVTFYYHMYGENTGEMSIEYYNGNSWQFAGWKKTGQQHTASDDAWTYASVNLNGLSVEKIRFKVETGIGFQGDISIDNVVVNMGGNSSGNSGGESVWSKIGSMVYYNLGNVGIGTDTPSEKLEVDGNIKAHKIYADEVCIDGDCDAITSGVGGESYDNIHEDNGNVGIGTQLPTEKLEVDGTIKASDLALTRKTSCSKLYTDVDGNVLCGIDATGEGINSVIAGEGLQGGGEIDDISLNVDTQVIQKRVSSICPVGQSISEIRQDGSVVCSDGASGKIKALKIYENMGYHICASFSDKSFRCWGHNNSYGTLGLGQLGADRFSPTHMLVEDVKDAALGYFNSCVVTNPGEVYCWGYGSTGENGDGDNLHSFAPKKVAGLSDVKKIVRGGNTGTATFCALKNNGDVYCWGNNGTGQVGDGTTTQRYVPTHVTTLSNIKDIVGHSNSDSASNRFLALTENGKVWAWGNNGHGQIGDGTTTQRNLPVELSALNNITNIYTGGDSAASSFAIDGNGDLYSWGYNGLGQLGHGNTSNISTPTKVTAISGVKDLIVSKGFHYASTCALKTNGHVYCWGYNGHGQVGDGTTAQRNTPIYIMNDVKALMPVQKKASAYTQTHCAIRENEDVYCWGYNAHGTIGNGTNTQALTPTKVLGIKNITQISSRNYADDQTNYAIDEDGNLYAWGYNGYGLFGIGQSFTAGSLPTRTIVH